MEQIDNNTNKISVWGYIGIYTHILIMGYLSYIFIDSVASMFVKGRSFISEILIENSFLESLSFTSQFIIVFIWGILFFIISVYINTLRNPLKIKKIRIAKIINLLPLIIISGIAIFILFLLAFPSWSNGGVGLVFIIFISIASIAFFVLQMIANIIGIILVLLSKRK